MIAEGWISNKEMELVHYHMRREGSILEVGCAVGKLFSYLYSFHPNWKYTVVDPFEEELVYLQKDWNKGYFEKDNLGELVTRKLFEKIVRLPMSISVILKILKLMKSLILSV